VLAQFLLGIAAAASGRRDRVRHANKDSGMVQAIGILLFCQLLGEVAARTLALPVPGPVVGLMVLFVGLVAVGGRTGRDAAVGVVGRAADGLLAVLGLLFVPAGVGVVQHLGLITAHGLALVAVLVLSTAITLVVTVLTFTAVARLTAGAPEDGP
jgi:putative effector of murein hydrolase LrgA (UPF0299 family)